MARITGVSAREAGPYVKLAYRFTRRSIGQLTGRAQLVELTHLIALENVRGRFNLALGIGAAGFSEGMVCAVPASAGPRRMTT
jgi:hypothetical protein